MIFKKFKKSISLAIVTWVSALYISAQEQQHFSMYYIQPSIVNPAAMGQYDNINGALVFNKQLVGFGENSPLYIQFDMGLPIGKTGLYLGPQILHDRIGAFDRTRVGLNIAYRIKLNLKHYLTFGINGAAVVANGRLGEVSIIDPSDPSFASNINGIWNPDIKIGAHYFTDNLYVGFNVGNIFVNKFFDTGSGATNEIRVNADDMHYYLMGGWQKRFGPNWKIRPNALIKFIPGSPLQIDINANASFKDMIGFGLSYRTVNTLVFNANYTINKFLVIGYAFNWGLGYESRTNYTGHEVMLAFRVNNTKRIIPVDVPRF
jgi:type IX secretion system PorP/SprF family membrane protein